MNATMALYLVLLALQIFGAVFFVLSALPVFRELAVNPGEQLQYNPFDLTTAGTLLVMQVVYWYRLRRVPIPFRYPNILLSHALFFMGRLSFIFGGALFAVVVFRHIPELSPTLDFGIFASVRRAAWLLVSLFALFCVTLELERLGRAFDDVSPK